MNNTAMTSRNVTALNMKAVDGPKRPRTKPARAGPNARAPVNCMEFSRTALSMTSCGTKRGTKDCQDAMLIPDATPETGGGRGVPRGAPGRDPQPPQGEKPPPFGPVGVTTRPRPRPPGRGII